MDQVKGFSSIVESVIFGVSIADSIISRLGNSGEDLTGLKGKTIAVSHQELAKHNKKDDCWMAVRGKVYNVTRYVDYHPGGVEQILRGLYR